MEDVLLQSATRRRAKSIFVYRPRLPTIRVMGSKFTSTSGDGSGPEFVVIDVLRSGLPARGRLVSALELAAGSPPRRLQVEGIAVEPAEGPDGPAVGEHRGRRQVRARRLVHERHEPIGEARHRAADADPADVGTSADAAHPAALAHVAV